MTKTRRVRKKLVLPGVMDFSDNVEDETDEEVHDRNKTYRRPPRRTRRKIEAKAKRIRRKGRKNWTPGLIDDVLLTTLRDPAFFATANVLRRPVGMSGPERRYNEIQFFLYIRLATYFHSFREAEAFFRSRHIHDLIRSTLERTWPDHPERRIGDHPMSRHQLHRHRRGLEDSNPGAAAAAVEVFEQFSRLLALNIGHGRKRPSSLAHPHPGSIFRGDGVNVRCRWNAVVGDMVYDPTTGEPCQARHDPSGWLGKDDQGLINPCYKWVVIHATDAAEIEQEAVVLAFERATRGGEAAVLPSLLERLKAVLPGFRHYLYDMAAQGRDIDRLYKSGLHPIVKVARAANDAVRTALIEVKRVTGTDGRTIKVPIYGVDGQARAVFPNVGKQLAVELEEVAVRERPGGRVIGEYRIPDHPTVPETLRGVHFMIRLDGLTARGKYRAQTLRWINEHTPVGKAMMGQRSTTESKNSELERTLAPGGRARSVGEFNNTLDVLGFYQSGNLQAALAHQRRTGTDPLGLGPPTELPRLVAA